MAVVVKELATSRPFTTDANGATLSADFIAYGSTLETDIFAAVYAAAPLVYLGMGKLSIEGSHQGGGVWLTSVKYGVPPGRENFGGGSGSPPPPPGVPPPPPPPPQPTDDEPLVEVSVEVGAQQRHVTNSLATITRTGIGVVDPVDYKGLIGVTLDGPPQGVDTEIGTMVFTITRVFPFVTLRYIRQLRDMVGTVNSAAWWGFPAGELKFLGANFAPHKQGDGPAGVVGTFKIAAEKNRTSIVIVPVDPAEPITSGMVVPAKKGWEYLWVSYQEGIAGTPPRKVQTPLGAYVEQIFETQPFTNLGLG